MQKTWILNLNIWRLFFRFVYCFKLQKQNNKFFFVVSLIIDLKLKYKKWVLKETFECFVFFLCLKIMFSKKNRMMFFLQPKRRSRRRKKKLFEIFTHLTPLFTKRVELLFSLIFLPILIRILFFALKINTGL